MKQPATANQPTQLSGDGSLQELTAWLRGANLAALYNSIAHELRGPLNAMSINLEMLKLTVNDPVKNSSDKPEHYIRILSESIRQLDQRLLVFFGHFAPTAQPLPVQKLLSEIEQLAITQAHTQSVGMKITPPAEENLNLQSHIPAWRQAALHLVVHALSGLGRGDEVTIEAVRSGRQLQLRVFDSASLLKTPSQITTPGLNKVSALAAHCGGTLNLYGNSGGKNGVYRELAIPLGN
ncbi:MAG TPA: histidine kinase dimerization/phospho-acceptor domain-containing protein [Gammaproteobacteria bacterium]|nr:histidine kinase dimerization/phospho-acceptor domain-containing protein [Gammaproteobacteria bacterium]